MSRTELVIDITDTGSARFIYDDALAQLCSEGATTITRASHVEPTADGKWEADLRPSGGPVLTGFALRQEALDAEIEWLLRHKFSCQSDMTKNTETEKLECPACFFRGVPEDFDILGAGPGFLICPDCGLEHGMHPVQESE